MNQDRQEIIDSLNSAAAVLIWLPEDFSYQAVACGLSLYLSLKLKNKNVEIVCPSPMTVGVNRLVGVDKVKTRLPGRNLVISFDYVKDAIEKVSYNVENGKFNLVVSPKLGSEPLSADKVNYSFSEFPADLAILISATSANEIPSGTPTMSLVPGNGKTLVGEVSQLIKGAGLPIDEDIAGNLFEGLVKETDRFSAAAAADFGLAAELAGMKAAKKKSGGETMAVSAEPETETEAKAPKAVKVGWSGPKIFRSGDFI